MNTYEGQSPENIRKVDQNDYNLQGLRSLHDHELAEGVPDVRGWKVVDRNGDRIGRVDDLIVDPVAQVVRYIDVDLRDSATPEDKDYHLLIPVGTARLDDNDDCVHADNLVKDQLASYPRANRGGINREYETNVRTFYDNSNRGMGQYFGNSRTDEVVGDRLLDNTGGTMGADLSATRSAGPDDASFHGSRDLNMGDTSLNEFRNSGTYGNVSNLDTSSDPDDDRSSLRTDDLDVPVTGSTTTTVTDSYTISGSEMRDRGDLDRRDDLNRDDRDLDDLNTPGFTSSTGLDSSTALRDSDILDSPTPLQNRGIIDGGDNLATGAYANNFMDEDRNDLNRRNSLDADDKQIKDLHDDRTNSYTDRGDELSDFAENQLRRPTTRSNQTEPGTLGNTDFYTDSYFDETRFFGNRYAGQRRGGISTFPEGEGRFTRRRRNI